MSEIIVRKVNFEFPEDIDLYPIPSMPRVSLFIVAFSLTMPYLEPYLIKMMLNAKKNISDEALLEDMNRFCQQEGNHYRNHARINKIIRSKFDDDVAKQLARIESDLKADYDRFLKDENLDFNLAYAEGFEAMTCAAALTSAQRKPHKTGFMNKDWADLLDWHGLEEIEHRTVAFDVFQQVCGKYFYRLTRGLWAQGHYLYAIHKFYVVMLKAKGMRVMPYIPFFILAGGFKYLNTLFPWYNPANYRIPDDLKARLEKYSAETT
ncbi:MAG: metal-dependent hydrolase [Pseudomonadales bacterium]|nr:metal-dependent hydrolase [Pseudomonadales bacterium]